MNLTRSVARLLQVFFRWTYPALRIEPLGPAHVEAASTLLSQEFCEREPLCRELTMSFDEIQPFFQGLVVEVAAAGLGAVALHRTQGLVGVLTIEDHFDLCEPKGALSEGLDLIGSYLEQLQLPTAWLPQQRGEIYHCGLAAVAREQKNAPIFLMLMLEQYAYLKKRGYRGGYAKVTNAAIVKRFRHLEKLLRGKHFQCLGSARPALFEHKGRLPFQGFAGESHLFAWIMP